MGWASDAFWRDFHAATGKHPVSGGYSGTLPHENCECINQIAPGAQKEGLYMSKFTVDSEYQGYVYVGNARGNFDTGRVGPDGQPVKTPYANMYVLCPTSDFESDDYKGTGLKAEKFKCLSPDVWANLQIGEQVQLFFDDKKRVQMAVSVAAMAQLNGSVKPDKPSK